MELTFRTEKVSPRVTRIFGFNTELMYLVEGNKRAALLDTGSGFGSLRACVDGLTDKPITVLLTHGHTDHALGAAEFDEVYMNPRDEAVYARHSKMSFRARSGAMWPDYDKLRKDQILPAMPFAAMRPLHEGDVFDLVGETVECFACPGHTPGSLVFLLREARMLLLGDACNHLTFLFDDYALPVPAYRESLLRLDAAMQGKYNRVLLSHGDGEGEPDMIRRVIAVCDDVIAGHSDARSFVFLGDQGLLAKAVDDAGKRLDGGAGNIVYRNR